MVISHKYKLIFIKNRKVAGTSVEEMLLRYISPDDMCSIREPDSLVIAQGTTFGDHVKWDKIAAYFPNEWKEYYKFAIERNPWDKVVSYYHWILHTEPDKASDGFESFVLSEAVERCCDWDKYAADDRIMVDEVILYEDLHNTLANHSRIPYNGELQSIFMKSGHRPNKGYHEYYTPELQQRVADLFSNEINYFGYQY